MTDCIECGLQLSSECELQGWVTCDECHAKLDEDRRIEDHLQDLAEQRMDEERRGEV